MGNSHQHTGKKRQRRSSRGKSLYTECDPHHCLTEEAERDLWQKQVTFILKNSLLLFQIIFMELASYKRFNCCRKTLSHHYRNKARPLGLGGQMDITEAPTSL